MCVCHSGLPDENCLELALHFLQSEEDINVPLAIEKMTEIIEKIGEDSKKSSAFLKLRQSKLIAECKKLALHEIEQIAIMIDAIQEAVEPSNQEKIIALKSRIIAAIS